MNAPAGHIQSSRPSAGNGPIRLRLLLSIAIIVPAGFALKYYDGPMNQWLNNSLAGAAYVVFWCLAAGFIWPQRRNIVPIVAVVLLMTCGLECMQLWKPGWLVELRRTFLGRTVLGTTFAWSDFLYYIIGAAIGWAWLILAMRSWSSARPRP